MKLGDMYNLAVQLGMNADPRGRSGAEMVLSKTNERYMKLDEKEREYLDRESLENPYSDTRILFGDPEKEVRKIIVGIDIEGDELIVARGLSNIDAAIAHHPRGSALARLCDVMQMQADVLNQYGVPINIAEGLLHTRVSEVTRGLSRGNHFQPVEIARLVGMPYLCAHTATDNLVYQFLKNAFESHRTETVADVLDLLLTIPEYRQAKLCGMGPTIFSGKKENRTGKIALTEITGGTEGAHDIYDAIAHAGIGTVISMHQSEKHKEFAEKAHINVVIAGHMSSDSIGMNLFLDELEKRGIAIVPCGGLIRVSRVQDTNSPQPSLNNSPR